MQHCLVQLDLSALGEEQDDLDLATLVQGLRDLGMLPVLLKDGSPKQMTRAQELGLGISGRQQAVHKQEGQPVTVVRHGLRSGQKAYGRGGDLVVLGPVNSGAEALADGTVHIYGPLRGRAMAGVTGNAQAQIFCQALHAELISIAGLYKTSDNLDAGMFGRPVQVFLDDERMVIEPMA